MKYHYLCSLLLLIVISCSSGQVQLDSLHITHPRLYIHQENFKDLKQLIESDQVVKHWYEELENTSENILKEPTVSYKLKGPRLLEESRDALRRISTLAGLYLIDGDIKKAERAKVELLAAANFKDWNPSHFLDVAEMTHAMAIGYDWLHSYLSAEDKRKIRNAIVQKGLRPGLEAYRKQAWWVQSNSNWNQVCNAGLGLGAMAIAEDEPLLSSQILSYAKNSIMLSMEKYKEDGGDPEGVMYWRYGTSYNIYLLDALNTAFDRKNSVNDFDLQETGYFRIYSLGPTNKVFNFSDSNDYRSTSAQMLWLARRFKNSHFSDFERKIKNDPKIFNLIWSLEHQFTKNNRVLPLSRLFKSINVAFFRSSWEDESAQFVGFKGGNNGAHHSHLDLGSFVYDILGERWAIDLGPDDYNLPGYFDGKNKRWSYLKLINSGHSTITINDENQKTTAIAPVVKFKDNLSIVDLSDAYGAYVEKAFRGIKILSDEEILIQDEITPKPEASLDVKWNMITKANISLRGNVADLVMNNKKIKAEILSPAGAMFTVAEIDKNNRSLRIHLKNQKKPFRLIVKLGIWKKSRLMKMVELNEW